MPRPLALLAIVAMVSACTHVQRAPATEPAPPAPGKTKQLGGVMLLLTGSVAAIAGGVLFAQALGRGIGESVSVAFGGMRSMEEEPSSALPATLLISGVVMFIGGEVLLIWGFVEEDDSLAADEN